MLPYLNYLCYDSFKDGVITQTLFSLVCLYIVFFVQFSRYEFRLLKSEINTQLLEYLFQTLAQAISNFDFFKERCAGPYSLVHSLIQKVKLFFTRSGTKGYIVYMPECQRHSKKQFWWAQVDSNHRPHAYQACALTT